VKVEATLHLANNLAFVGMLIPAVVTLPVLASDASRVPAAAVACAHAALFLAATLSVASFYGVSQRAVRADWKRRLALLPAVMALCIGLSANNSVAVLQGLARRRGEFVRTPKYAIVERGDAWRGKRYVKGLDWLAPFEIALAANAAAVLAMAFERGLWLFVPFALLSFAGFLYVGGVSLIERCAVLVSPREERATALAGAAGGE
jgi:hypothetical protein